MLQLTQEFRHLQEALASRYEFERELGQGALATVFLARDLRHERLVALKILRAGARSDEAEIRFTREIRFLARLQHPNILPLFDSGHVLDAFYYVVPFVDGLSLRDRIRREHQLPIRDAVQIASEIADALDYAHARGVVHRDIKPENILLSGPHPLVADFGVARAIDAARLQAITAPGIGGPGTPAYMSPEQFLGTAEVGPRTDIYSLGCVLYEMLSGEAPFVGKGGLAQRFSDAVRSVAAVRHDASPELTAIVTRSLRRDAGDRFSTAAEMKAALLSFAASAPTPATRRSSERRPIGVPSTRLIGRESELVQARALLDKHRLVTLTGPGGVGKSRLAMELAKEREAALRDGCVMVSLVVATTDEALVASIAEAVGIEFSGGRHPKLELLDALSVRQVLILLDGFEHLIGATALVAELTQCAKEISILVTSRERLNVGDEAVLEIRGLLESESGEASVGGPVQLFLDRAASADPQFAASPTDLRAIRRIAKAVGGLPLGIEIAASLARVLRCDEIATELESDLGMLVTSRRDLPDRHRSLAAVFDQSWQLLGESEKVALMRLALLRVAFDREAAVTIANAPLSVFVSLLDKSLVQRTMDGRFQLHEVVQQLAQARLHEHPDALAAAEDSRCEYFARWLHARRADLFGAKLYATVTSIGENLENVRSGWRRALELSRVDLAPDYVIGLYRFYLIRGRYAEGETELALAESKDLGDLLGGLILSKRAALLQNIDPIRALRLAKSSVAMLRPYHASSVEMGIALNALGYVASEQGWVRAARRLYTRAQKILRERGPLNELGSCLLNGGISLVLLGDYKAAENAFRDAQAIAVQIGDLRAQLSAMVNLATAINDAGRRAEALELRRQALALTKALDDGYLLSAAWANLGESLTGLGQYDEARAAFYEARRLFQLLGRPHGVASAECHLAQVDRLEGHLAGAEEHLRTALRQARTLDAVVLMLWIIFEFASLREAQGQKATARNIAAAVIQHPSTPDYFRQRAQELVGRVAVGPGFSDGVSADHGNRNEILSRLSRELAD